MGYVAREVAKRLHSALAEDREAFEREQAERAEAIDAIAEKAERDGIDLARVDAEMAHPAPVFDLDEA